MTYFFGIEVKQNNKETTISQASYAKEISKKFFIQDCQPVDTHIEYGTKLTKKLEDKPINEYSDSD